MNLPPSTPSWLIKLLLPIGEGAGDEPGLQLCGVGAGGDEATGELAGAGTKGDGDGDGELVVDGDGDGDGELAEKVRCGEEKRRRRERKVNLAAVIVAIDLKERKNGVSVKSF